MKKENQSKCLNFSSVTGYTHTFKCVYIISKDSLQQAWATLNTWLAQNVHIRNVKFT
jgi:hypothetical protein